MPVVFTILIFSFVGSLGAWKPVVDINRIHLVNKDLPSQKHSNNNLLHRRSITPHRNDNEHHSGRLYQLPAKLVPNAPTTEAEKDIKPREDPRYYYLSDTYAKKVLANRLSNEVAQIYPGQDEVRAMDNNYVRPFARLKERQTNHIPHEDTCVSCPRDRTLIAKPGSDRVLLQRPRLTSCEGHKITRDVRFIPTYGARFGTLLKKGSYKILGQIKQKNHILKHCQMTVDVLIQNCALPKYLIAHCGAENNTCRFECRSAKDELQGASTLTCGEDLEWSRELPTCSARKWCKPQPPPPHGRVSCKGTTVNGWGLAEGSKCRIKCARGWKPNIHLLTVCRKGAWTQHFSCLRF